MLISKNGEIFDQKVINLIDNIQAGDLLIFNDAKVIKAKLQARIKRNDAKQNDKIININLDQGDGVIWQALCKPAKKVKTGDILEIANDFSLKILEKLPDGFIKIEFLCKKNELSQKLDKYGEIPLPPYIKRQNSLNELEENLDENLNADLNKNNQNLNSSNENSPEHLQNLAEITKNNQKLSDLINYQTIYAKNGTAVAAPTAGLHFTDKIFELLEEKGIKKAFVTLNVGAGTFLPVRSENILDHKMHSESFSISKETANLINETKKNGKKIIAVGTTSMRVLESSANENGEIEAKTTSTNIFIYPGYKFKIVDILMTNFHLPKSTLFMLICAFTGVNQAFKIYNHAIQNKYRFYSYGDSSLIFKNQKY